MSLKAMQSWIAALNFGADCYETRRIGSSKDSY